MSKSKERRKEHFRRVADARKAEAAQKQAAVETPKGIDRSLLVVGRIVRAMTRSDDPTKGAEWLPHYCIILQYWGSLPDSADPELRDGAVRVVYGTSQGVPRTKSGLRDTEFMLDSVAAQAVGLVKPTRWDAEATFTLPVGKVLEVAGMFPSEYRWMSKRAFKRAEYRDIPPP